MEENQFLYFKSINAFVHIKDSNNIARLAKKSKINRGYLERVLCLNFEKFKLIYMTKVGKDRLIFLTKKGFELQKDLRSILNVIKNGKE